jgi:hypothetical protein
MRETMVVDVSKRKRSSSRKVVKRESRSRKVVVMLVGGKGIPSPQKQLYRRRRPQAQTQSLGPAR